MSPPVGEVARSAGGADRKTRALTTLHAGVQLNDSKALKGCGGKQEFSPTSHILSYKPRSSETVRLTVSEVSGADFFDGLKSRNISGILVIPAVLSFV